MNSFVVTYLIQDKEKLIELMALEMGKPLEIGKWEMGVVIDMCFYYADNSETLLQDKPIEKPDADKAFIRYLPLGVLLCIEPWNFPFYQVFRPAAAGMLSL